MQTECPNAFFLFNKFKPLKHEHIAKPRKTENGSLEFKIKSLSEVMYVGVKAMLDNGKEITYNVIEIATLWASLHRQQTLSCYPDLLKPPWAASFGQNP